MSLPKTLALIATILSLISIGVLLLAKAPNALGISSSLFIILIVMWLLVMRKKSAGG